MSSTGCGYLESADMTAVSDLSTIRDLTTSLERAEVRRLNVSRADARDGIARRIGVAPGTLDNIRRERSKIIPNWLMQRVRSELISTLTSEIRRLQHELELARQAGVDHRDDALCSAEAHLAAARALLRSQE